MDSRWLGVIVLIIIVGLGGWYVFSHPMQSAPTAPSEATTTPDTGMASTTTTTTTTTGPMTVAYTNTGFSPASITVAQGQSVTFVNQSSGSMWVASDPHPSHTAYDGTSRQTHCAAGYKGPAPLDECTSVAVGGTFTFTFTKAGTFGYHNHADDSMHGTVVVTAAPAATSASVNVQVQ